VILIGYWNGDSAPGWPVAQEWVDPNWDPEERQAVVEWLRSGEPIMQWRGLAECRFCGCANGNVELSDGVYMWPEGLPHYLEEHQVRLPRAIVRRAMDRPVIPRDALREADGEMIDVDRDWWRGLTPDWTGSDQD
jgi:hypothetical protein